MSSLAHTVLFYLTVYVQGRMTSKLEKNLTVHVNVMAHKYTFLQRLHSSGNTSLSVHCAAAAENYHCSLNIGVFIYSVSVDSKI